MLYEQFASPLGLPKTVGDLVKYSIEFCLVFTFMVLLDKAFWSVFNQVFQSMVYRVQRIPHRINFLNYCFSYGHLFFGFYYFVLLPHLSVTNAFWIGYWVYGVLDITNFAFFENYDMWFLTVDMFWGSVLFALTAYLYYYCKEFMKLKQ